MSKNFLGSSTERCVVSGEKRRRIESKPEGMCIHVISKFFFTLVITRVYCQPPQFVRSPPRATRATTTATKGRPSTLARIFLRETLSFLDHSHSHPSTIDHRKSHFTTHIHCDQHVDHRCWIDANQSQECHISFTHVHH